MKMSAEELGRELQEVYSGDRTQAPAARNRILQYFAAIETDNQRLKVGRNHDTMVLARQAVELERLQGIECRAEVDVKNAEAARESAQAEASRFAGIIVEAAVSLNKALAECRPGGDSVVTETPRKAANTHEY